MSDDVNLHLFQAYGIEVEYMIVDAETFAIRPLCDQVLKAIAGTYVGDVEFEELAWSNELVLHVIELKTNGPRPLLRGLSAALHADLRRIDGILAEHGARLMPSGTHPFMDPLLETTLWPHDYSPVYEAFDRIFSCKGHGWSNLQSVHINLPFADDEEFGRLHAAIRVALPILPALSASTPIMDGKIAPHLDQRLAVYRSNARAVPSVSGRVVPEQVFDHDSYQKDLLQRIYRDIAKHDPEGILQEEWLNARGAIARFDRMAIEIRILDSQECPTADHAMCALVIHLVRALVEERWSTLDQQKSWPVDPLADVFDAVVKDGDRALIENLDFLALFGQRERGPMTAGELWRVLRAELAPDVDTEVAEAMRVMTDEGPLARRILKRVGADPTHEDLVGLCRELSSCLVENRQLR
ncbi:MAG: glutamate--cysteine ligase [Planctomycetes bacterium]|nr:glutamate--cysteine ligase [Planctomycetota bacterium]